MRALRAVLQVAVVGSAVLFLSCGDGGTDPNPGQSDVAKLEFAGFGSDFTVGETVTLAVRAQTASGQGVSGITVTFASQDGVSFASPTVTTGSDGRAEVIATLPTAAGSVTISATGGGVSSEVTVEILPGPPASIEAASGDQQIGTTGEALAEPVTVLVTDEFENPVEGASVIFEGQGGASVSTASTQTDAEGRASTEVTLGAEAGPQGVVARNAAAGEVTFGFTAELLFESITVTPSNATLSQPYEERTLTAEALDGDGEPVSGQTFTWTSSDRTVASVDANGTVTALKDGTTQVVASANGIDSDPAEITVQAGIAVDREGAIAAARAAVVDDAADGCFVLVVAPLRALLAGSTVTEALELPAEAFSRTINDPTWFMLLDLDPFSRWGHPVQYIFVDAGTGAVTVEDALGPPLIDGELRYLGLGDRVLTDERVEPVSFENASATPTCEPPDLLPPSGAGSPGRVRPLSELPRVLEQEGAGGSIVGVVINGGHPPGADEEAMSESFDKDAEDMTEFLEERIGASVTQYGYRDHTLLDVINGIRQLAQDLGPDDKLVIYYVGHGWPTHLSYGAGTPNAGRLDLTDPDNDFGLQSLVRDLPVGTINVALDACYAGSAIAEMTADGFEPGLEGGSVNVFAGADARKTGNAVRSDLDNQFYDDWKNDPALDEYRDEPWFDEWFDEVQLPAWIANTEGTFTENFLDHLEGGDIDADGDGSVTIEELENGWSDAQNGTSGLKQMPPPTGMFVKGTLSISAPDISFEHIVGSTACPQAIGPVTFTNGTQTSASWNVFTGSSLLAFRVGGSGSPTNGSLSGSLAPGESVTVEVFFNCGQASSFTASITSSISAGSDSAEATTGVAGNVHY